jgi:hypothetical protein
MGLGSSYLSISQECEVTLRFLSEDASDLERNWLDATLVGNIRHFHTVRFVDGAGHRVVCTPRMTDEIIQCVDQNTQTAMRKSFLSISLVM